MMMLLIAPTTFKMLEYFGDIVVYKGNKLEDKILRVFTGEWTHTALRINRGSAQSLNYLGKTKHNLDNPKIDYHEYIILRHKEITEVKQRMLRRLNKTCNSNYDLKLLLQIAFKKMLGGQPDSENMFHKGKSNCSSRIAQMYDVTGLEVNPYIHFSQMEPHHFIDNPNFKIVGEWKR